MAPILVANNRGITTIRGRGFKSEDEIRKILDIRCHEEDVDISDDTKRKGKVVEMEDASRVYELFWDVKRSTQYLIEYQSQYMLNEAAAGEEDESNMMV
ncbi:AAA+ ATPase domain-containing protein [Artemisia annua]|uniref:AAA+ ATPase domain-containing protein n=1 Tax=Artemisia annua TaxID=35608 RepID=A0A2U1L6B7_ARTAN|nr:AAA+ ATPase domain-containing protein [Artemisia annua]